MATFSVTVRFRKNIVLLYNPTELKEQFLYGIKLQSRDGTTVAEDSFYTYIKACQEEVEHYLGIKFARQIISENVSFFRDEFQQMGFIRVNYPVMKPYSLDGYLGTIRQISYPVEWLSYKKTNDGLGYYRHLYIVPNAGAATTGTLVYQGIIPYLGISSYDQLPNYWTPVYCTGFDKVPYDLLGAVGKLAAIQVLLIAGNLVLGRPGVSSTSLSIDALSQSLSANNPFNAQIEQYRKDLKDVFDRIKFTYKGIVASSM
jgi:hypothetical protein